MALTGRRDGPALGPPAGLVPVLQGAAARLRERSRALGEPLDIDPIALLGERAAVAGLNRNGRTSCGGATQLLPTADGAWLAVSLARPDDVDLVPAWLGLAAPPDDVWTAVAAEVAGRPAAMLEADGARLGLPIGVLPPHRSGGPAATGAPTGPRPAAPATRGLLRAGAPFGDLPVLAHEVPRRAGPIADLSGVRVVDLSSLWAGPLCGALLTEAGARVVKVESSARPDGARAGPPAFFDLLNAGKRSVALDLRTAAGRTALQRLVRRADVVIAASRPRALTQLGIDAATELRDGRARVWASITGHGRSPDVEHRVGFGDDAAVAGGLVSWDGDLPCFTADAVADPATGLVAAVAVLDALAAGGRWLLDLSLADVAGHLAGPTLPARPTTAVAPPRARAPRGAAPGLGEHTGEVLTELGARR
jgi:hypothetical protein